MLSTVIEWFKNPESLLVAMGPWVLWGTMLIVLIESGVLFPVLPGESLLFTAGLLHDRLGLHLPTLILMVVVAAFVGAQIGYFLGAQVGAPLLQAERPHPQDRAPGEGGALLHELRRSLPRHRPFYSLRAHLHSARRRYGPLPLPEFLLFNTLGSVIWGAGFILVGALLGNVPFVHDNLTLILAVIILASVLPVIIEMVGKRRAGADKEKE